MDNYEIRDLAKTMLRKKFGAILLMVIVYIAITSVSSTFSWLIIGPMSVGYAYYLNRFVQSGDTAIENLFKGFSDFLGTFVLGLLQALYIFLWTLLFIIPGIIKGYSYFAAEYIKAERPDMSANESITLSRKVMDGNKFRLFALHISIMLPVIICSIIGFICMAVGAGESVFAVLGVLLWIVSSVLIIVLTPKTAVASAILVNELLSKEGIVSTRHMVADKSEESNDEI